ncbi:MAG: phenylalanine--tRNA ligase subunit beta, partial [Lachnospiraceae bacterium]|nr:phenylalanine--tRNA ligase subunit beta [Lachnospiraceae bacterium]
DVNCGNSVEPREMKASLKKVNDVLGIEVPTEDVKRILTNLNFAPVINGDELTIQVPAYREDMESFPDISEELIRMYGYDHVVPTFLAEATVTSGGMTLKQKTELKIKRTLCAMGASEGIHYSFISPADLDLIALPEDAEERKAIRILNPINEDLSVMRTTLVPQMIHAMGRNEKRGRLYGRIFELGNRFIAKELPLKDYPDERATLSIGAFGDSESFFTLKAMVEAVADTLNLTFTYEASEKPYLHPYRTAKILCNGEEIGFMGQITYEIQKAEDMRTPGFVAQIDLKSVEKYYAIEPKFVPLPKFDIEKRDLAIVMDKTVTCGQAEEVIKNACRFVTDVQLFDVFEGAQIGKDKKSLAFTVTFTPGDEAFGAGAVDGYVSKILKNLKFHLNAELRS